MSGEHKTHNHEASGNLVCNLLDKHLAAQNFLKICNLYAELKTDCEGGN